MTVSYTEEGKFPLQEDGGSNWGAIINGVFELLDAGHELTLTAGEAIAAGDAVAVKTSDGLIYKAESNDQTLTPAIGFAPNGITSGNEGKVRSFGWLDVSTSDTSISWSPGEYVYVDSTAGDIDKTRYSWANCLGFAKDFTDASFVTRIGIRPHARCDELVRNMAVQKQIHRTAEVDNGSSGATATIDWTEGNHQMIILSNTCVLSFGRPDGACDLVLRLIQDGSGSRTVTWDGSVLWPGGTAPTLSTGAWDIDVLRFYFDGANYYGSSNLDYS
jgi:hypothetical protein